MDIVTETFDLFEEHVPHGHEAFMVLQTHLLLEMRLRTFVETRITDDALLKEIFNRNSAVNGGKGLIILARSIASRDDIQLAASDINWKGVDMLNNLRNDLVHDLKPNSESIVQKMKNFIGAMDEEVPSSNQLNAVFRICAFKLITAIGLHLKPAIPSDFDVI